MSDAYFDGPLARLLLSAIPPGRPDPWPKEIDIAVRKPDAVPLCINCLYPQAAHRWFCPHCAHPSGDCVMFMPYLQIFCVSSIFRAGVLGPPDRRFGANFFLFLYSLTQYSFFAPLYWFWMLRKAQGKPICDENRKPIYPE